VTVVDCAGKLVAGLDVQSLNEQVRSCLDNHASVVVNLGAVTFIDSSGLGLLVRLANTTRNSGPGLRFCGANDQIQKILELTKLKDVLRVHATEEQAIEAFSMKSIGSTFTAVGANVLCADESVDLTAYLRESLDKAGFRTHSARTIPDAILLLRTMRPDAVITGPQFASKVTALATDLKVPLICLDESFAELDAGDAIAGLLDRLRACLKKGTA
jgi:anti-anti-sigma factor